MSFLSPTYGALWLEGIYSTLYIVYDLSRDILTEAKMLRRPIHLVPDLKSRWNIKHGGSNRSSKHFDKKRDAVDSARNMSRNIGSELHIHYRDGKISKKVSHAGDLFLARGSIRMHFVQFHFGRENNVSQ